MLNAGFHKEMREKVIKKIAIVFLTIPAGSTEMSSDPVEKSLYLEGIVEQVKKGDDKDGCLHIHEHDRYRNQQRGAAKTGKRSANCSDIRDEQKGTIFQHIHVTLRCYPGVFLRPRLLGSPATPMVFSKMRQSLIRRQGLTPLFDIKKM
jgi:hypothetical protein